MRLHRLGEHVQVVPSLQQAHDFAAAVLVSARRDHFSQRDKILVLQSQRADRIGRVGVESRADQKQLGLRMLGGSLERCREAFAKLTSRDAKPQRQIRDRSLPGPVPVSFVSPVPG